MSNGSELSSMATLQQHGDIAVIMINNPPVNALSLGVREGILEGIKQADADDSIKGIVLACAGRTFIAGADITEFGKPPQSPSLWDAMEAIENATKPVVAAIHGTALGGGLETALVCHYRVCDGAARFGLPEVKLGLLPGAGGTQRLPRVVGVQKALEMVTSGKMIGSAEAAADGLVDQIVDGDLTEGAIAFATKVVEEGKPLVKIRDQNDKVEAARAEPGIFDAFRRKIGRKTRNFEAPEANIQCIEAAVNKPFDEGLAIERELFGKLMSGNQSAAQRYYFFAERQAAKVPDIGRDTPVREIKSVGVLGAGTMGGGISMNFAQAGIPVTIVERDQAALDRGLGVMRKNWERGAKKGRMTMADVDRLMGLITGSLDKNDFADKDLVIEAVFENMDLKRSIFKELDGICKPGAIMASNTSYLDVNEMAAETSRPGDVIGMHFFSPANIMRLLEIVRAEKTSADVLATVLKVAKKINKVAAVAGVCGGFIGNRMLAQRQVEANNIVLEGATPAHIDQVLYDFGFPMGPFAMSDLAGLDIGWDEASSSSSTMREVLCESGRRGQKNGRGYYVYDPETRASSPDPEVEQMIRDFAEKQGIEQRDVSDQEILDRCLLPMVNEGAKILEEKKAIRSSDIDVVWVNGYGWPVYHGGPMFWAELRGLADVKAGLEKYGAGLEGEHWKVSPLLAELAEAGKKFQDLPAQNIE